MIDISVIIPVFNLGERVEKIINILHHFKKKNLEFLIVNDGSNDNTDNIINSFLEKIQDSRFKYYYIKNQGVSVARNFGLDHIHGKYVWFIDADDEIVSRINGLETLDYLYDIADKNSLDILEFGFKHRLMNDKVNQIKIPNSKIMSGKEFLINVFKNDEREVNIQIWHFLINASFLKKNNIKFRKGIIYGEDLLWDAYIFNNARRVMSISEICYIYVTRNGSVTMNKNLFVKKSEDLINVLTELIQLLNIENMSNENKKVIGKYLTKRYIYTLIEAISKEKRISSKENTFKLLSAYLDIKDRIKLNIIFDLPIKISSLICNLIQKTN